MPVDLVHECTSCLSNESGNPGLGADVLEHTTFQPFQSSGHSSRYWFLQLEVRGVH